MSPRYFTVEEVNALLPKLEPLVAELLDRRARVVREQEQVADVVGYGKSDTGSVAASNMVKDFMAIERLANRVRSFGCELKDINVGLLDFLAEREGREVFLCWRFGEPRVSFYHELHTGFAGRQPI